MKTISGIEYVNADYSGYDASQYIDCSLAEKKLLIGRAMTHFVIHKTRGLYCNQSTS